MASCLSLNFFVNSENHSPVMKCSTASVIVTLLLCVDHVWASVDINNWTYYGAGTGQEFWNDIDGSHCTGSNQSPINIVTSEAQNAFFPPFNLAAYDTVMDAELENIGHAVEVDLDLSGDNGYYDVTGGGLVGAFRAFQFHFHWGSSSYRGSEHRVNNQTYPAEMHVVHYNTSYPNPREAKQYTGGIGVLGFFLEVGTHNPALNVILDNVDKVKEPNTHTDISGLQLSSIFPSTMTKFWRYNGSLTTPLCNEVVVWTMFKDTIKISEDQLNLLRALNSDAYDAAGEQLPLTDNYRFIQNTNCREVFYVEMSDSTLAPSQSTGDFPMMTPSPSFGGACQIDRVKILLFFAILLSVFSFRL